LTRLACLLFPVALRKDLSSVLFSLHFTLHHCHICFVPLDYLFASMLMTLSCTSRFPPASVLGLYTRSITLDDVHTWLSSNRLHLNTSKSEFLLVGRSTANRTGQQRHQLSVIFLYWLHHYFFS